MITAPLNGNVTPRSGARKSRIGTESPSTPSQGKFSDGARARLSPGTESSGHGLGPGHGLAIVNPRIPVHPGTRPKNATVSPTPVVTMHGRISASKSMVEEREGPSPKFFHADDAKSAVSSPGIDEHADLTLSTGQSRAFEMMPAIDGTRTEKDILDEKFVRADDIPIHVPSKAADRPHGLTKGWSAEATLPPRSATAAESWSNKMMTPPSPTKNPHGSATQLNSPRKAPCEKLASPLMAQTTLGRRRSANMDPTTAPPLDSWVGHRKSMSTNSISTTPVKKLSWPREPPPETIQIWPSPVNCLSEASPKVPDGLITSPETSSPRSTSLNSSNTFTTSVTSDTDHSETFRSSTPSTHLSALPAESSPSLPPVPPLPPSVADEAANARRERKVLDLEISNSSLLAINKTLERELRKQSIELRRFRRLSRSGRLSLAPARRTASGQSASTLGTVTELDGDEAAPSDIGDESDLDDNLDDDDDDHEDEEEEDYSVRLNNSGSLTSPTGRARQRARDEKRLILDLSKHQQLLIDSQKLSQSIKRCLTCTEELIRDGNKALDYRVGIGDVSLGGRVLNHDELDDRALETGAEERENRQGLLSPGLTKSALQEILLWAHQPGTEGVQSLDGLADLHDSG